MNIVSKEKGYNEWRDYLHSLVPLFKEKRIPAFGVFELTKLCNFDCNMCYIHLDKEQQEKQGRLLTSEQWIEIAKQAKSNGTLVIELTGGEIFTRADFRYIYEFLYDAGFLLILRSNGYLINGKTIEWLKKRPPYKLYITIYGSSDETYQKVCGIKDGYTVVSSNIGLISKAGIPLALTMTLTKENIVDLPNVHSWVNKNHLVFIGGYSGLITPFKDTERRVDDKRIDNHQVSEINDFEEYEGIEADGLEDYVFQESPFARCKKYGAKFTVTWDGKLTMCSILRPVSQDIIKTPFREAYESLYRQLDKIKRPQKCVNCKYNPFCHNCPAFLFAETGNPEAVDEAICVRAKNEWYNYIAKKSGK